jgi:hypothetical protein
MPMTLPGLYGIGLNDWPSWFRSLNPGYFASEKRDFRRGKARLRMGEDGCCAGRNLGPTHVTHVRAERLRTAGNYGRQKKESLTEHVLAKLRGSPLKEEKMMVENPLSGSVMLERASMKDAKDWEDEGSETSEETSDNAVDKSSVAKTSLLD